MILTTSDQFLSLPCAPDTSRRFTSADRFPTPDRVLIASPRLTKCRLLPLDAQCIVAHCVIFMRVGIGAMTDEIGKVIQIKVTIQ